MGVRIILKTWARDLAAIIWPRTCAICGRTLVDGEDALCLHCLSALPLTRLHRSDFNSIHQRLATDVKVERAGAMMPYHRVGLYSGLIRKGKYNSRPDLIAALTRIYAGQLKADGFFDGIDLILPVPMHTLKKLKRGYNQSEVIAKTIAESTGIPVGDNLRAVKGHATQTRRTVYERHANVSGLFDVTAPEELNGLHVLLVDDVITSGATLHACALALTRRTPGVRISVVTLATATV